MPKIKENKDIMNSISALITVIFIVLLSVVKIECTKVVVNTDNYNNTDSLNSIYYNAVSVDSITVKQKDQSFRKM